MRRIPGALHVQFWQLSEKNQATHSGQQMKKHRRATPAVKCNTLIVAAFLG
jgi:hypothetical protein